MAASVTSYIALQHYTYSASTVHACFISTQTRTLLSSIRHHNLPRILHDRRLLAAKAGSLPPPPDSSSGKSPNFFNGVQAMVSRTEDRIRIFFAVLFWLLLFFWGSAWNGRDDGDKKKGRHMKKLDKLGALDYNKIVNGDSWRLFTCMWLHGGVIHLLANMLSLLFIGVRLEQEFGFVRIGALYIISGLGGSLMSSLSVQTKISVGASGALFGLLGAMLSELITNWTIYSNKCAALLTLLVVIALNMAIGIVPHVDRSAHLGGFLAGFLLGFVLLVRPQFGWVSHKYVPPGHDMNFIKPKYKLYQYVSWILAFIMLVVWYMNDLIQLFGNDLH